MGPASKRTIDETRSAAPRAAASDVPVTRAERSDDGRREIVLALAGRLRYDREHAHHVARLALELFDATRSTHLLDERWRELLEFAALLHDVGHSVSPTKHHRHSYYLIAHSVLPGFAPQEILAIATIARFHRGSLPRETLAEVRGWRPRERESILRSSAILRIADGLDRGHRQVIRELVVLRRGRRSYLTFDAAGENADLERWGAVRRSDLWQATFGSTLEPRARSQAPRRRLSRPSDG